MSRVGSDTPGPKLNLSARDVAIGVWVGAVQSDCDLLSSFCSA
jgi:hypothetical protein